MNILQWIDVHECKQGFSAVTKNYSTCILFLPSEVTTKLVNIIVDMKVLSQLTTTTKLLHLIHTIPHTCSHRTSNKEWGNNMDLFIHQEHDKDSHLIDHPIK
jgi:hypothetical protein